MIEDKGGRSEEDTKEKSCLFGRQMACKSGATTFWKQRLQPVRVGMN